MAAEMRGWLLSESWAGDSKWLDFAELVLNSCVLAVLEDTLASPEQD